MKSVDFCKELSSAALIICQKKKILVPQKVSAYDFCKTWKNMVFEPLNP